MHSQLFFSGKAERHSQGNEGMALCEPGLQPLRQGGAQGRSRVVRGALGEVAFQTQPQGPEQGARPQCFCPPSPLWSNNRPILCSSSPASLICAPGGRQTSTLAHSNKAGGQGQLSRGRLCPRGGRGTENEAGSARPPSLLPPALLQEESFWVLG